MPHRKMDAPQLISRLKARLGLNNNQDGFGEWSLFPPHSGGRHREPDASHPDSERGYLFVPKWLLRGEVGEFRKELLAAFEKATGRHDTGVCPSSLRDCAPYPHVPLVFVPERVVADLESQQKIITGWADVFEDYHARAQARFRRVNIALWRLNQVSGVPAWKPVEQSTLSDPNRPLQLSLTLSGLAHGAELMGQSRPLLAGLQTALQHSAEDGWDHTHSFSRDSGLSPMSWTMEVHARDDAALEAAVAAMKSAQKPVRDLFSVLVRAADATSLIREISGVTPKSLAYWNNSVVAHFARMSVGDALKNPRLPDRAKQILFASASVLNSKL